MNHDLEKIGAVHEALSDYLSGCTAHDKQLRIRVLFMRVLEEYLSEMAALALVLDIVRQLFVGKKY